MTNKQHQPAPIVAGLETNGSTPSSFAVVGRYPDLNFYSRYHVLRFLGSWRNLTFLLIFPFNRAKYYVVAKNQLIEVPYEKETFNRLLPNRFRHILRYGFKL